MIKSTNGKIYIKKHTLGEWLTLYIFLMPFFLSFVIDFLKLPDLLKYTIDIVWVLLFAVLMFRGKWQIRKRLAPFLVNVGVLLVYVFTVYLFNFQSPFYFLWGFRNIFRFYVGFWAFATFFDEEMATACLKFADILFWINAAVTVYQFFVMGLKQDYLGGIFGVERGCNGYSTLFFILIVSKSLLDYMDEKEKAWLCLSKCAIALIISAMAELKFFFLIFIVILVLTSVLTKFSWRKVGLMLAAVVVIAVANAVLTIIFGQNRALTFDKVFELIFSQNYASTEDLGRFTAIPTISETFLTTFPKKLFGMGLGNADTSAFAICNTPFFEIYGDLHYSWFNSAFLFLETGYVGLTIYLAFFVVSFISAVNAFKNKRGNVLFSQLAIIFSIMCIVLTFYNSTMRRECAFIMYFVLALPIMAPKSQNEQIEK